MKLLSVIFSMLLLQSSLLATVESKLLEAIPAECNIVIGVELGKVMALPMVKGMLAMSPPKAGAFDPKQIKSMVIGLQAEDEAALADFQVKPQLFIALETVKALTMKEIFRIVDPKGAELEKKTYLNKEYFSGMAKDGQVVCIHQISSSKFIVATQALMEKGIMVQAGKGLAISSNKLMAKLLKSDGNLIYAGGFMKKSLEYKGFSLGASYSKGLNLKTRIYCKKAETATMHAAKINAMLPFLMASPQLGLKADSFKIAAKKSTLYANAFVPEAALMQIPKMVMSMMQK